ncbi:hypothetical protein FOIG_00330 [Fusarium odoratissimum NRRL 54006]|uniref:Uncharacterized protein n=2 Tax=Fusarium oxysporum species complex TaxID=171631 RepID=X0LNC0_FUSO5|nr:uncharacterized protein FOIG_00330 [Fusarium odoratissimum NRRL 54006]XP_031072185.1 uncharacterized protein FOIG_00330 [Fusarium odoratissimum NRRL 54006]XP_031072186.1 uncharacterized protein FOIG_00330 [Fusarium odoratissimum NRRL 54006]TXC05268.1 hypothetical protein FocTR4_00001819 [Fusarium oxysporum f. sp. cubense]EXM10095.1 hypothetical protein FOIG_00330 [Fusarium odoratissimum NRRL 54006]EXM10096.1 hypothetical protein FOIG_00330 [Fusarium odoratissimum NRRL 54006]EXM10097.1 hypo
MWTITERNRRCCYKEAIQRHKESKFSTSSSSIVVESLAVRHQMRGLGRHNSHQKWGIHSTTNLHDDQLIENLAPRLARPALLFAHCCLNRPCYQVSFRIPTRY